MQALPIITLYQAAQECSFPSQAAQTENDLYNARASALRKQQGRRWAARLKSLVPVYVLAQIEAHRSARDLRVQIKRLEDLSPHLLGDIGVEQEGFADYVVRTDDLDAVRAWRLAHTPLLPVRLPNPLRQIPVYAAG